MVKKLSFFAAVSLVIAVPVIVSAAALLVGEQPSISTQTPVLENMTVLGANVVSQGTFREDLVAFGGNLLISGTMDKDVLLGGGSIAVMGDIGEDVRVIGGNITLNSAVGGDVFIVGGQIQIIGSGIDGDVFIAGGTVRIDAPVAGKIRIAGGAVYLNGPVEGNVDINADEVTLGSSAVITGDLTYRSTKEMTREDGAQVLGETTFTPWEKKTAPAGSAVAFISLVALLKMFAIGIAALVLGLSFRRYFASVSQRASEYPWVELGRGLVAAIVVPIVSVLLLITVLGMPLGFLGLFGFVALAIFTAITAPIVVGAFIFKKGFRTPDYEISWRSILLGVLVYSIISIIPFVGWVFGLMVFLMSMGAVVRMKWEMASQWR
jgi:hypothetical protein